MTAGEHWHGVVAAWQRLTWPGRAGGLALLAGLAWTLWLLPSREAALERLREQGASQRAAVLRAAGTTGARARVQVPPDEAFLAGFPPLGEREARVMSLWQHAREHGVEPLRSEFRLSEEAGLGLMRYRIAWPVTGTYVQLRGLIDAALAADPALSLDAVELTRVDEQPGLLKAQIAWSLWMRGPTAGRAMGVVR